MTQKTIIDVLIGKSYSGKTTEMQKILKIEQARSQHLVQRLMTTTTRPKRDEDQNHPNYHFMNNDKFKELEQTRPEYIIAKRTYQVFQNNEQKEWSYFINRNDLIHDLNQTKHLLLIIDWQGYKDLYDAIQQDSLLKNRIKLRGWYLNIPLKERLHRLTDPKSPRANDDPQEALRRLYYDEFVDFKELDDIIKNNQENEYHLQSFNTNLDFEMAYSQAIKE